MGRCPPSPSVVFQGWCDGVQLPGDPQKVWRRAALTTSHHPFTQYQQSSGLTSSGHAHELLMKTPSCTAAKISLSPRWVTHSL